MRDEEGFTTVGMVLALLITLSLVFTSAQVYRINSASADVQEVADASALAAENVVAEFMIAVRVCDAVVLSLSLTSVVATGLGVAALCTPPTAAASETLLKAGRDVMRARDSFAQKAADGLNRLQKALPFLAAANAASIASSNNGGPLFSSYQGFAMLVSSEGKEIGIDPVNGAKELEEKVDADAASIKQAAKEAEEAAQEAKRWKEQAFRRDCGDAPGYCMYERASTLAGMAGARNPRYSSVDAWSFSVALERARAYYANRLDAEAPESSSVEDQARSILRKRLYEYASSQMEKGYVHESADSFDAFFPRLPKNTEEMRNTELYAEKVYPVTRASEDASKMHAWPGCPDAGGWISLGSIEEMEHGNFATCSRCDFSAASLGKVAAASTSIENGFEYHYAAVAEAADAYQKAREELDPLTTEVKKRAGSLFDGCLEVLKSVGGMRINVAPPGRFGAVAFVVNVSSSPASTGFANGFVHDAGTLGARAAVSASTLVEESSEEGKNVLSSLLDGWRGDAGAASGTVGLLLDCWSGLLDAYAQGQDAVDGTVRKALGALPFAGASGLGSWASGALSDAVEAMGLQPAKLEALKPAVVNSAHVAAFDEGAFGARFLAVKKRVVATPLSSVDLFGSAVTSAETAALEAIGEFDGEVQIASIEPLGDAGPSIPVTIALPPALRSSAESFVSDAANAVRSLQAQVTGARAWE